MKPPPNHIRIILTACLPAVFFFSCVNPTVVDPEESSPHEAIDLNSSNFDSLVIEQQTVAVVEFYDRYCETCISMAWVIDSLASRSSDSVLVGAVDTYTEIDLADRYPISAIPSYLYFKDGELITQVHFSEGSQSVLDSLTQLLEQLLAVSPPIGYIDTFDTNETDSSEVPIFTLSNFDSLLATEDRLILIDFFSPTCSHCIAMEPIVADLADQLFDRVMVAKVNAPNSDSLKNRYTIQYYPSFLFFSEGVEVRRVIGQKNADYLITLADSLLQN